MAFYICYNDVLDVGVGDLLGSIGSVVGSRLARTKNFKFVLRHGRGEGKYILFLFLGERRWFFIILFSIHLFLSSLPGEDIFKL